MTSLRVAGFLVSSALGVVLWNSGCGPRNESYYCDATGCFTCDGYGCTTVNPPTKNKCTGNASCPAGQICTSLGCSAKCQADTECAKGEVCKAGTCAPPSTNPVTQECTTKADCGASSVCVGGKCQACGGTSGPCTCTGDAECGTNAVCQNGACTPKKDVCQFTSECETGKLCANGQCVASCDTAGCSSGYSCVKGACIPDVPTTTCTDDTACSGSTPKCVGGSCTQACTADAQCGNGRYCNQGACVPDTRPKPNCTDDTQCNSGGGSPRTCLGGYCKFTCTTDAYCRSIDSRIGYCGKDSVCRTAAEANPQCVKKADCTGGKDCVDNACL